MLVEEQHPIFAIPKRNGKHRLLQDLRPIKKHTKKKGSFQSGFPRPISIPYNYHIIIIDIKDCFFSTPIAQQEKPYFASTFWEPNTGIPAQRYQWTVLPQLKAERSQKFLTVTCLFEQEVTNMTKIRVNQFDTIIQ